MTSHESWVEPPHEPCVDFHVFDEQWRRLPLAHPEVDEGIRDTLEYEGDIDAITSLYVPKSERFQQLEKGARDYLHMLGFDDLPPLYLFREGEELAEFGLDESSTILGIADPLGRFAVIRLDRFENVAEEYGDIKAASVFVHEMIHLANVRKQVSIRLHGGSGLTVTERQGFGYASTDTESGSFLEEAIASYFGGLYVRICSNSQQALVSFRALPEAMVPDHYIVSDYEVDGFPARVMGPDGYALEILMWKLEQNDIISTEEFVANLLKTRHVDTQAEGMRKIIQALDTLEPGLYKKLCAVQYGKENWRDACAYVYELATGDVWRSW